jgi:predicted Rdx family selenoprotein
VAAQLKQDLGVSAAMVVGDPGEFTIWLDDTKIAEKRSGMFPDPGDVVAEVRARAP